jgi:2-keto-4-pentenoate hydratase
MTTKADRIAAKLAADWAARADYETLSGDLALADAAEAYAAQDALRPLLEEMRGPVAGRKIALTSKAMQEMVGFDRPAFGILFAADLHDSPAEIRADAFNRLGLEFELALSPAADVPPRAEPWRAEEVPALLGAVRPAFELIEDRSADYAALDVLTLIADNAWCGGAVLGPEIPGWRELDLNALPATVRQSGAAPEHVHTGAADPLGSFAAVLNHFGARGETLAAGEIVITGSAARTRFPKAGDAVTYEIDGLAKVELSVV